TERVAALDQLDHELREAERTAPEALRSATTSVRSAERFVTEHDDELGGWVDRLEPARAALDEATTEAEGDERDWLLVVRRADEAQSSADALRRDAVDRVSAVREARRRLTELETDLSTRADALARYVDRHHGDVRSGVEAAAETTRIALAERDDDPVARVERLEAVDEALTKAEDDANADVAAAQRRRQRRGGVILVGGGWPGGFSGGGFGGGGMGGGFGGGFGGGGFGGGMGGGGGSW
ncbi:MAG: hypothetical protein AAGA17_17950, partial [Actinomycetota bacterium]